MKHVSFCHLLLLYTFLGVAPLTLAQQMLTGEQGEEIKEPDNLIKFKTHDELLLAGYYSGTEKGPGVLLLHDCASDGASYLQLSQALADLGIHALALDLRGYGYSANIIYSHDIIKKISKDLSMYQSEMERISSFWESDILAAFNYLQHKIGKEQPISVVSSGCTAPQAVYLAEKIRIRSLVMITPTFTYMDKEKYKNLIDLPAYFLSSAHHAESHQVAKELYEWNGDIRSTMQVIKGNNYGDEYFYAKPYLINNIALWLKESLSQPYIQQR
ncbi:MAG: alpha/beta hydrolase [Thalassotalea sp.]